MTLGGTLIIHILPSSAASGSVADLYSQLHASVSPPSILSIYFVGTLRGDRRVYSLRDETAVAVG